MTSHGGANPQPILMSTHKARIARFNSNHSEGSSIVGSDAALSVKSNWYEPRGINETPRAVPHTWVHVSVCIDASDLARVDIHRDPVASRKKEGGATQRVHRRETMTALSWHASVGSHRGDVSTRERKPRRVSPRPGHEIPGRTATR